VYISFADAREVLTTLDEILPAELKGKTEKQLADIWPSWVKQRDNEIRARLAQGDEDSLVNFLLFGTSFTKQPRVALDQIARLKALGQSSAPLQSDEEIHINRLVSSRINDLLASLRAPGSNERLLFARRILVDQKHFQVATRNQEAKAIDYLRASVNRVLNENAGYARTLEAARLQGDPTEEFAQRSQLFRTRGLASDTSLFPNFATEESLKQIQVRGLMAPGSVRRVAIVGPGLDFTDKQEGYDFYPLQTIQPFAVIDTLLRLRLARALELQLTTFDLSPRVNNHLERARQRARAGLNYVVQLPRDLSAPWKPETVGYWERFGDQIGTAVPPVTVPAAAGDLRIRAIRIRPAIAASIWPVDTNIVLQNLQLPETEKFDLIIGTNIFLYYDNLDQSLAMMNIQRMLRPGGLLLSNNALLELPFFRIHSVGYSTVLYSDRPNDGDTIVWYQRSPD
jgi:SAM-dependent methyltransferase